MTIAPKPDILAAFERAEKYDDHAVVQRRAAQWLADRLTEIAPPAPIDILEIGCGTGFVTASVADRLCDASWLLTDISPAMVERSRARLGTSARYRYGVMDGEKPQLDASTCFDIICSNLTVQWFGDLDGSLRRLFQYVKPGGHLLFTTLADGTFEEWKRAHREVGVESGALEYPDTSALRKIMLDGVRGQIDVREMVESYASATDFLHMLRNIGAGTPVASHRPLALPAMRKVMRRFEANGATASYTIVRCCFRRPSPGTKRH